MKKYSVGIDFGSLSGRAVLVDLETGAEVATSVFEYPHAVMSDTLPSGRKLDNAFALQHPQDYIDVLKNTVPAVVSEAGIEPSQVIGLGIDFTACTMLPILTDGTPLCMTDEFSNEPHAYVKMWKHHAAQ